MPKLLPVCPFVETLPWDEEELLLFRSELDDRDLPAARSRLVRATCLIFSIGLNIVWRLLTGRFLVRL